MGFSKIKLKKYLQILLLTAFGLWILPSVAEQGTYYRYINKDGVKVLDTSIPPEYAQKGYEILNRSGQVIEVVAPAPTAAEIAQQQSQQEILFHYDRLRKRYSDVAAIESARKRRLDNLETSISILNGNISTLQSQLENQMGQAATREREGKTVPVHILDAIANSKAELAVAEELLDLRLKEKNKINQQFDKDIEYFVKGEALAQQQVNSDSLPN